MCPASPRRENGHPKVGAFINLPPCIFLLLLLLFFFFFLLIFHLCVNEIFQLAFFEFTWSTSFLRLNCSSFTTVPASSQRELPSPQDDGTAFATCRSHRARSSWAGLSGGGTPTLGLRCFQTASLGSAAPPLLNSGEGIGGQYNVAEPCFQLCICMGGGRCPSSFP